MERRQKLIEYQKRIQHYQEEIRDCLELIVLYQEEVEHCEKEAEYYRGEYFREGSPSDEEGWKRYRELVIQHLDSVGYRREEIEKHQECIKHCQESMELLRAKKETQ